MELSAAAAARVEPPLAPAAPPRSGGAAAPPSRSSARRAVARRVGEGVLLAAVFVVAGEAACRVEDRVRYGTPFFSRVTDQGDLAVRDADGAHGRPNAAYQKWVMNNLGMRGPDATAAKPAGTLRVVTVGASETFGLYESAGREYPRQLEDSLRARLAGGACAGVQRVEVLNGALPGMSLPTIQQDVRTRLARLQPDVIVIYPTPAGYLDNRPPVAARPDSTGRGVELPLSNALKLRGAKRVRDQIKLLLPTPIATWLRRRDAATVAKRQPAGWRFTSPPPERLAQFEGDLRAAVTAMRAAGAQPVVATHANTFMRPGPLDDPMLASWERFYPRATGPTIVAFDSVARDVTVRVARESGAQLADVAPALAAGQGQTFADFVHFTDAGAALAAGALTGPVLAAARAEAVCR